MKKVHLLYLLSSLTLLSIWGCKQSTDDDGPATSYKYDYKTAENDPLNSLIHTLDNGLKIYMSVNKKEPRLQTMIAVRAGSSSDPADATGLAHYLEHMLFKGTSNIASLNWEEEKKILKQISDLYEEYRATTVAKDRKEIYAKIDALSQEAAKYVAANEYDKMISSLGAKGTNAFTSIERTVYVNDIPANELEKWLHVESERMKELVLRLFHTELEAVYEEYNISMDRDGFKSYKAFMNGLFPNHPYGTQTTIGEGQHLKNPSMEKIHAYFDNFYAPNNMAIVLAGDIDPDATVDLVKKYFGEYESREVKRPTLPEAGPINGLVRKDVNGPEAASVDISYRLDGGAASDNYILAQLTAGIMTNGQAGTVDLNLNQKQLVGSATAYSWALKQYGIFGIEGAPKEGQSLEEVKDLYLAEIEKIKKGEFDEWLIDAVIKNKKLREVEQMENNRARTSAMMDAFIMDIPWSEYRKTFDRMSKYTKKDIVDFANKHLNENMVIVYKNKTEPEKGENVEKPTITPIKLNKDTTSNFFQDFVKMESSNFKPDFLDFKKLIKSDKLKNGVPMDYIKNPNNMTFSLNYIVDMGKKHDKLLPIAIKYLPFLGTEKYTAEELQKEFFKLGLNFDVFSGDDQAYVTLRGLDESLDEGVQLFEHILANVKPDPEALKNVISDIKKKRADNKNDKRTILRTGMVNHAKFGKKNPFTDILSDAELAAITPEQLIAKIKELTSFEHTVFYYGTKKMADAKAILDKHHKVPETLKPYPQPVDYPELPTEKDEVVFVNYPEMVRAEVLMISKGSETFNMDEYIMNNVYNNYFGAGLSSIVFQEIRESKALAYSAYAWSGNPRYADKAHYLQAYVGTQADKLPDAVNGIKTIMEDMPVVEEQIGQSRSSILKRIESERITNDDVYWTMRRNKLLGFDRDIRQDTYNKFKSGGAEQGSIVEDLKKFQAENIKGRKYTYLVLGDKSKLNMDFLKNVGPIKELSMEEVFGY